MRARKFMRCELRILGNKVMYAFDRALDGKRETLDVGIAGYPGPIDSARECKKISPKAEEIVEMGICKMPKRF